MASKKIEQTKTSVAFWLFVAVVLLAVNATALARLIPGEDYYPIKKPSDSLTEPYQKIAVHDIGEIGLTVTNIGQLGTGFIGPGILDPATGLPAPSCEYPLGTGNEYLFAGAFWIGAVVGDDTLVSVGMDGWNQIEEMWPDVWPDGDIIHRSIYGPDAENAVSEKDFVAVYTDTLTDPAYVENDPIDGPHIPLNIEVTQNSYAWSDPYTEDYVIFDYNIKNIGAETMEKTYFGIYVDGDVFSETDVSGYLDDICGFRKTVPSLLGHGFEDTINLAWIADNDGLPSGGACPFGEDPLTAVTGVRILRTPSDSANITFNYWFSNLDGLLDWGPRQDETPFRDFGDTPGQQLGTPTGDHNKYYIMSHPEIDYDQIFAAVPQAVNGWLSPLNVGGSGLAQDFADGYDTRYLLSVGPFDIAPGQTLPIAFACVAGENFHTVCNAFDSLFDYDDPQPYYDYLNFSDIGFNAVWAEWVYDNPGVDTDGDGYRGMYYIYGSESTLVCYYDTISFEPLQVDTTCGYEYVVADTLYYEGDGVPDFKPPDPLDIGDNPTDGTLPEYFALNQNHPNPFNPNTTIGFSLTRNARVKLEVYNILGQKIKTLLDGELNAGDHEVEWDGRGENGITMPTGVYFYRIETGDKATARKMLLLK